MTRDRLLTLDAIRGVAVLGILLLNIVAFGLPQAAYLNPRAYGGWHGADLAVYLVNFVLFDGKMRGLFSFLFGASLLLVVERAEAAGKSPARVHYARMIWLLAFGYAHLLLLWWGDILAHYATIGMIAFLFRRMPPTRLVALGIVLVIVNACLIGGIPWMIAHWQAAPGSAEAARGLGDMANGFGVPPADKLDAELALFRGPYPAILAHRLAKDAIDPIQTFFFVGPETLAYMLFGMAGLKSGLLAGEWSRRAYLRWAGVGLGIGIAAYSAIAAYLVAEQFGLFAVALGAMALPVLVRPVMILGWACLILLLLRPGGALTARFAAAGRMAFSNYLATSAICTTIFYGYGLGWFGWLSRAELYPVVLGVWALILLWSKPWLARFRYGPLEWLWRSLARGRLQPMRGAAA